MPQKDKETYNKYQREYRRRKRKEDPSFLQKELERSKEYWSKPENKIKRAEVQKRKAARRKLHIDKYKVSKGCSMCRYRGPACCFDFHHVNGEDKDFTVAQVYAGVSLKTLFKELRKCILVCSNCHRKIHGGYCGS